MQIGNGRHFSLLASDNIGMFGTTACDGKDQKDADGCFRKKEYKRQLTSGLLTIYCEHGVCHGFTLLRDPESESDVFNFFFTRVGKGTPCTSADLTVL